MTITRSDWTAALRSGQYKQTQATLMRNAGGENSYCCLGVACAIAKEGLTRRDTRLPNNRNDRTIEDIVPGIMDALDLDDDLIAWCIDMNDDERKTFDEIADAIDALPA